MSMVFYCRKIILKSLTVLPSMSKLCTPSLFNGCMHLAPGRWQDWQGPTAEIVIGQSVCKTQRLRHCSCRWGEGLVASPLRMRTHEYCSVKTIAQIWDLGATSDLAIYTLVASQEWSVWYNEFRAADYNGWRNRQKGEANRGLWQKVDLQEK